MLCYVMLCNNNGKKTNLISKSIIFDDFPYQDKLLNVCHACMSLIKSLIKSSLKVIIFRREKKQFLINAITMPDPVYQYNARAFLFCVFSLGTRCPCTLKQSLLSKITDINTVRFAFKINSLDKIVSLSYLHACKT